jgi:hypothetical protein
MSCKFCYNAHVWRQEPRELEDYFDGELHDGNDFSSTMVGNTGESHQIYINSGNGKPLNIEICQWFNGRWHTIGHYYPKYCPECGRELNEYKIDERGRSFVRLKDE